MANIQATISLKNNASSTCQKIIKSLTSVSQRLNAVQSKTNSISTGFNKVNSAAKQVTNQTTKNVSVQQQLNGIVRHVYGSHIALLNIEKKIGNATRNNAKAQANHNQYLRGATNEANRLFNALRNVFSVYALLNGAKNTLGLADTVAQTRARLGIVNELNGSLYETAEIEQMIYEAAMRSRGSYLDTAKVVGGLGIRAADAFGDVGEIVRFTEVLNKMGAVSGTKANELTSALYQINQAMGAGKFQGDEFRSVSENLPLALQAVARYKGVSVGALKDMAKKGEITADVFKNAVLSMGDEIDDRFKKMPITWGQVWNTMKNHMLKVSDGILQEISKITQSDRFVGFMQKLSVKFQELMSIVKEVFTKLKNVAAYMYDNWNKVKPVIIGVSTAFVLYKVAVSSALFVSALFTYYQAIMAARAARVAGVMFAARAQMYGMNAAMLSCPWVWLIAGLGILCGAFISVMAATYDWGSANIDVWGTIKNIAHLVAEKIKSAWVSLCEYIKPAVEAVGEVFNNVSAWIVRNWDNIVYVISVVAAAFVWLTQVAVNVATFVCGALNIVWEALCIIWDVLCVIGSWVSDNSGWIIDTITAIAAAIGTVVLAIVAVCGVVATAILIYGAFCAVVALAKGIMALFTIATWKQVAANIAATVTGWAASSPLLFWIVVIGLVIAAIVALVCWILDLCGVSVSAVGIICGAFAWMAATIWNIIVACWNGILQFFDSIINLILGVIEFFLNAFGGGFDSFGAACFNLFGQIIAAFLDLGKIVTTVIDAIFGSNYSDKLEGWANSARNWGKSETSVTIERNVLTRNASLGRVNATDWYDAGYDFGSDVTGSLSKLGDGLGDTLGFDGDLTSKVNKLIKTKDGSTGITDDLSKALTGGYDGSNPALDKIAGNTGEIADNTSGLSGNNEDTKYLRELAEREAINRYTLTDLNVKMTNNNTMNSDVDVEKFGRRLWSALSESARQTVPLNF